MVKRRDVNVLGTTGTPLYIKPMPPHFQFKLVATDENKRIQTKFLDCLPFVYGVYGENKLIKTEPTINCNASAGMDATEF